MVSEFVLGQTQMTPQDHSQLGPNISQVTNLEGKTSNITFPFLSVKFTCHIVIVGY